MTTLVDKMDKVGRYQFRADTFHCDFSHRLFMGHLGNDMLNAADFHSSDRQFGMMFLNTINKTWVLSRLAIEMEQMPREHQPYYIETWVENAMRYFTHRNFRISDAEDHTLGYGRSIWAMIDTASRQPQDILAVNEGSIMEWIDKEKECPIERGGRVKMTDHASLVRTIDTYYHDVDVNGHINSMKYMEHVLDLWPLHWYETHSVRRFEIAYVAEAHQGDQLFFYQEQTGALEFCVRICRSDATEVVRSKVSFY